MAKKLPNTKDMEYLDSGSFGSVFKLSPRRIIKIFNPNFAQEDVNALIEDEIEGGKDPKALPVLRVIKVRHHGKIVKALVKRRMLREATWEEIYKMDCQDGFDMVPRNCMADTRGNVFKVDTMTEEGFDQLKDIRY